MATKRPSRALPLPRATGSTRSRTDFCVTSICTIARESVAREGGCQRFHQGPGQIDKLWIVDVDGVPVIIDAAWYDETPPEHVDELEAIVASTTFGE